MYYLTHLKKNFAFASCFKKTSSIVKKKLEIFDSFMKQLENVNYDERGKAIY